MKKSLAIIFSLILALGIIVSIGISAYADESNTQTLPEFSFPQETYKNLADYGLPIEEIMAFFPETIETKVENGVLYVKDIGAAEVSVFCYGSTNRLYMTLADGYWTTTVTEEDVADSLLIEISGEQYWRLTYLDGKMDRSIVFATGGNVDVVEIYLDGKKVYIAYSPTNNSGVANTYENGVLVSHEVRFYNDDDTYGSVIYDADKNPIVGKIYTDNYYYILEQGWSRNYSIYDPISAPEGFEGVTLETFAELAPAQISCKHDFKAATCTSPKTCDLCGETEGEALGHTWVDANCTAPKTCSVCSETEGEALGHTWVDANCTTPKTCSVCSETEGEALGHTWKDATTEAPKTCESCDATEGDPLPQPEQTNWFVALINMILEFLKRIFGLA